MPWSYKKPIKASPPGTWKLPWQIGPKNRDASCPLAGIRAQQTAGALHLWPPLPHSCTHCSEQPQVSGCSRVHLNKAIAWRWISPECSSCSLLYFLLLGGRAVAAGHQTLSQLTAFAVNERFQLCLGADIRYHVNASFWTIPRYKQKVLN